MPTTNSDQTIDPQRGQRTPTKRTLCSKIKQTKFPLKKKQVWFQKETKSRLSENRQRQQTQKRRKKMAQTTYNKL